MTLTLVAPIPPIDVTAAVFPPCEHVGTGPVPAFRMTAQLTAEEMTAALLASEFITSDELDTDEKVRFEIAHSLMFYGYFRVQTIAQALTTDDPDAFDASHGGADWVRLCCDRVTAAFDVTPGSAVAR
jgi:hypothetical protein